jgi:hypothetical protein
MFDKIRDVCADATVGQCRVLLRHGRGDVLPRGPGKTKGEPVNKFPDRSIRVQ